jgi:hypothetical protein
MIREQVLKMVIYMEHLATRDMTSNTLTKALAPLHIGRKSRSFHSRSKKQTITADL